MLISNDENLKIKQLKINDQIIIHMGVINILDTKFNHKLNWKDTISKGTNSLITQLKQRRYAILKITKNCDKTFTLNYANALYMSKINYHIEAWGLCSKTEKLKIE